MTMQTNKMQEQLDLINGINRSNSTQSYISKLKKKKIENGISHGP